MTVEQLLELIAPLRERFAAGGHRLYLVGGIVRDLLLGSADDSPDFDLTTDAQPDEIFDIVRPLADDLWTQGARFGTVGCRVGASTFEITTHRSESYVSQSRKPVVVYSMRVEDDLSRRDFTINAIAIDVETGVFVDPFDGRGDLATRTLRTPLAPEVSFSDDPLRMLRAARFAARFDLRVTSEVRTAMHSLEARLSIVSSERIHDEFERLLALDDPAAGLRLLHETGVLARFMPMWRSLTPPRVDELIECASHSEVALVRRAILVADFADEAIAAWMKSLRYSQADERSTRTVCRVLGELSALSTIDDYAVRRLVLVAESLIDAVIRAARCRQEPNLALFQARLGSLRAAGELDDLRPELDGDQVQALLQIPPGRDVGRGLAFLQDLRLREGRVGAPAAAERLRAFFAGA